MDARFEFLSKTASGNRRKGSTRREAEVSGQVSTSVGERMPVKTDVREQVIGALEECQRGLAVHRKCIVRLKQAQIADPEEFWETFVECLNRALLVFKIDPAIERFMRLVAGFVSFTNEKYARDGEMASSLLEYMIPLTASKDKAVRFRTCQLTSRLLNGLGDDSEVLAAHTFTDPRIPTTREAAGLMGGRASVAVRPKESLALARSCVYRERGLSHGCWHTERL